MQAIKPSSLPAGKKCGSEKDQVKGKECQSTAPPQRMDKQANHSNQPKSNPTVLAAPSPLSNGDWMEEFIRFCEDDSVKLAQNLADRVKDDAVRREWMELTAHRLLQELLLLRKGNDNDIENLPPPQPVRTTAAPTTVPRAGTVFHDASFDAPYQRNFHAEDGESAFKIFHRLVTKSRNEHDELDTQTLREKLFDKSSVSPIIQAKAFIDNSGMLFNEEWKTSLKIPETLLLPCLSKSKLVRADAPTLKRLAKELNLWTLLPELLDDWGLDAAFPTLIPKHNKINKKAKKPWNSSNKIALQCLVFVTRTYRCMQALKWTNIRGGLARKVWRCLQILEDHAQKERAALKPLQSHNKLAHTSGERRKSSVIKREGSENNNRNVKQRLSL